MAKHTPGPWKVVSPLNDRNAFDIESESGTKITRGYWGGTASADARLIASAPDLLEACKELVAEADAPVGWDGHPHSDTAGFQFARDAITKAEGRDAEV